MLWLLAIVPLAGAAAIAVTHVRRRSSLGVLACLVLASTLALAASAVVGDWSGTSTWNGLLRLRAALTPLSALVAVLVPAVALPVLGYAAMHEEARGLARLVALLLAFVGAMELLVIADDLLTVLIGWELVGACSWALIGHEWRDIANPRSGVYAFLLTRAGDLGMFAAAMAAFAGAGSFAYADLADFQAHRPFSAPLVGVELADEAQPLEQFHHPRQALYLLGPEDGSLSRAAVDLCQYVVSFDSRYCLNVASAGTVVLYDRHVKVGWKRRQMLEAVS